MSSNNQKIDNMISGVFNHSLVLRNDKRNNIIRTRTNGLNSDYDRKKYEILMLLYHKVPNDDPNIDKDALISSLVKSFINLSIEQLETYHRHLMELDGNLILKFLIKYQIVMSFFEKLAEINQSNINKNKITLSILNNLNNLTVEELNEYYENLKNLSRNEFKKQLQNHLKGGKKSTSKKIKKVRKHQGIYQKGPNKGKLKPGFKYSGKKTKTGLKVIVKVSK